MRKAAIKIISVVAVVSLSCFFVLPSILVAAEDSSAAGNTTGFVQYVYSQVLGRNPSQNEINQWTNNLNSGKASGFTLVNAAMLGVEKGHQINALSNKDFTYLVYQILFQRLPDLGGLNAWYNRLQAGFNKNAVLQGFVSSPEFNSFCANFGVKPYLARELNSQALNSLYKIGSMPQVFLSIEVPAGQNLTSNNSGNNSSPGSSGSSASSSGSSSGSSTKPKAPGGHDKGRACSTCH